MRIGVFDSGLGGMTLLNQALKILPEENYLYFADVDNVPYGEKTNQQIIQYVDEAVEFMIKQQCKALVIACNTATSVGVSHLRREYSNVPIIGIEPAVKPAILKYRKPGKRVLVVATPVTIREEKLHRLIERYDEDEIVDVAALPGLVHLAEEGRFGQEEVLRYLREALSAYDLTQYGVLVLGCTHFNFFKDSFEMLLPGVTVIDGSRAAIIQLKNTLVKNNLHFDPAAASEEQVRAQEKEAEQGHVIFYESCRLVTEPAELQKLQVLQDRWWSLYGR